MKKQPVDKPFTYIFYFLWTRRRIRFYLSCFVFSGRSFRSQYLIKYPFSNTCVAFLFFDRSPVVFIHFFLYRIAEAYEHNPNTKVESGWIQVNLPPSSRNFEHTDAAALCATFRHSVSRRMVTRRKQRVLCDTLHLRCFSLFTLRRRCIWFMADIKTAGATAKAYRCSSVAA